MTTVEEKLERLRGLLREAGSALVAFSGGVDSALLLKVAVDELGECAVAMLADSPSIPRREVAAARALADRLGARLEVVATRELSRPEFRDNPPDRCFHCKAEMLAAGREVAARHGLACVLLGTNLDDLGDHRPGIQAALEAGARQPLVEAGMTKADVREASRLLGLPTWDKPQAACLSSRFPYGTTITDERLGRVERFEDGLRDLGLGQVRVRFHDAVARVEVPAADLARALELRLAIVGLGKSCGFTFVALDLAGFVSGSLNQLLPPR